MQDIQTKLYLRRQQETLLLFENPYGLNHPLERGNNLFFIFFFFLKSYPLLTYQITPEEIKNASTCNIATIALVDYPFLQAMILSVKKAKGLYMKIQEQEFILFLKKRISATSISFLALSACIQHI